MYLSENSRNELGSPVHFYLILNWVAVFLQPTSWN